jgi:Ca-activated chloride channel family protein
MSVTVRAAARAGALFAGLALPVVSCLLPGQAQAQEQAHTGDVARTVLVLDASGSMWQQIEGGHKITIARSVVGDLLDTLPADRELGLWAYGHTRKGDCGDIEELVPAGQNNRAAIRAAVDGLNPKGKTPLSDAVRRAAEALRYEENAATVILISDGRETCDRDPCAVAREMEAAGIDFTAHVIGFDVSAAEDQAQLRCLAENTGGTFRTASDAAGLRDALVEVASAPPPQPDPAPEPEPAPAVALTAPATAPAGSRVDVSWTPTLNARDKVTIVARDAPEGEDGDYKRTGGDGTASLQAPGEPGLYEVRYLREADGSVVGRAPIELTGSAVTVTAPATAPAGSRIAVEWSPTVNPRDYVTIVPMGAPDDQVDEYKRAGGGSGSLQTPSDPGLYEVRYVLQEGRAVLGRASLELTGSAVTVTAPATAPAGSRVAVEWSPTVNPRDYVTIVPKGAPDDRVDNYKRAGSDGTATVQAPDEPGLYEVRYVLQEGRRVVGRAPLELTDADISLTVPATAPAGSRVTVTWTATVNPRDYVTIVPMGAPDDQVDVYKRAGGDPSTTIKAPESPGLYEVRYVLSEGRRLMARAPLELTALSATLEAPDEVVAGAPFDVSWQGPQRRRDRVELVPAGAPPQATPLAEVRADRDETARMTAPTEGGAYQLRYRLGESGEILGTADLTVTAVAASLSAPDTAAPGATVTVGWTGPGGAQDRIAVASADQGPFQWLAAGTVRTDEGDGVPLTLPGTPGRYELRYVDVANGVVLATRPITVQ